MWLLGINIAILCLILMINLAEPKHEEQYQSASSVLFMTVLPLSLIVSLVLFIFQILLTGNALSSINEAKEKSPEHKIVLERYVDCVLADGEIIISQLNEKCMDEELDKAERSSELTMKIFRQAELSL
jgi:uncharacterized membrane protein